MRRYRGKRKDNGEWIEGGFVSLNKFDNFIIPEWSNSDIYDNAAKFRHCYPVDPATVGQSTGLKDKNGKEIWEGDRVKIMTHWDRINDGRDNKYRIETVTMGCSCGLNTNGMVSIQKEGQKEYEPQLEIIGNIHEEAKK